METKNKKTRPCEQVKCENGYATPFWRRSLTGVLALTKTLPVGWYDYSNEPPDGEAHESIRSRDANIFSARAARKNSFIFFAGEREHARSENSRFARGISSNAPQGKYAASLSKLLLISGSLLGGTSAFAPTNNMPRHVWAHFLNRNCPIGLKLDIESQSLRARTAPIEDLADHRRVCSHLLSEICLRFVLQIFFQRHGLTIANVNLSCNSLCQFTFAIRQMTIAI